MTETNFYGIATFSQDLDAYSAAVKTEDFREANIFANRIMSNAFLADNKEFGIIGYILKELANDGMLLQQSKDKKSLTDFSKDATKLTGKIVSLAKSEKIDFSKLWDYNADIYFISKESFMTKNEISAYRTKDTAFSKKVLDKLVNILNENRKVLSYPTNNLLRGILNEISRLVKNHSLDKGDAHFVSLLIMLQRIDEYIKGTSIINEYHDRIEKELLPLVEELMDVYGVYVQQGANFEEKITNLLWKLIKLWRLYFIEFMELPSNVQIRQEKVAEEPVKSKLVDAISKEIEKEVGSE